MYRIKNRNGRSFLHVRYFNFNFNQFLDCYISEILNNDIKSAVGFKQNTRFLKNKPPAVI